MNQYDDYGDAESYSEYAREILDLFEADFVTVFFYFEDEGHEVVYERLLMRLFPEVSGYKVICLGGKHNVIKKAKEKNIEKSLMIFVVDKDFDDILGKSENIQGLYYLKKYSLENYLFDTKAFIAVAAEELGKASNHMEIASKLKDTPTFVKQLNDVLLDITRYFVVARKYGLDIQTTKTSVDMLLEYSTPEWPVPNITWIQAYREKIKASCVGRNDWLSDDACLDEELKSAFIYTPTSETEKIPQHDHVCGKHLLGCLEKFFDTYLETSLSTIDAPILYTRILNHINIKPLLYLAQELHKSHPEIFKTEARTVASPLQPHNGAAAHPML